MWRAFAIRSHRSGGIAAVPQDNVVDRSKSDANLPCYAFLRKIETSQPNCFPATTKSLVSTPLPASCNRVLARAGQDIEELAVSSLGDPSVFPIVAKRVIPRFSTWRTCPCRPPARSITRRAVAWVAQYGLPAVLKLDGSWGRDVVIRRASQIGQLIAKCVPPQPLRPEAGRRDGHRWPAGLRSWAPSDHQRAILCYRQTGKHAVALARRITRCNRR